MGRNSDALKSIALTGESRPLWGWGEVSSGMTTIQPGRYRHYKGKEYVVLDVARHSETEEELVVYRQDYGDRGLWVRPKNMFIETVEVDGQQVPRFQYMGPEESRSSRQNLFADIPTNLPQELVQTLAKSDHLRIERIVSLGHASPEGFSYDQDQAEFVILLAGVARLRIEGDNPVEMKPGDFINIPAYQRHRVEWTTPDEPSVWLAIHHSA